MKEYHVYIMASGKNGTLYIGVTDNLLLRVQQHKDKKDPKSFTAQYNVNQLVYFETTNDIGAAIYREKQLKKWNRDWKTKLIESGNPNWKDLYEEIIS